MEKQNEKEKQNTSNLTEWQSRKLILEKET